MEKLQKKVFALSAHAAGQMAKLRRYPSLRTLGIMTQRLVLCAVLARATLFGQFAPFSVAMVGALCAVDGGFAGVMGAFIGYVLLRGDMIGIGYCAAAVLTLACSYACADFKIRRTRWFMPLVAALSTAASGFVFLTTISVREVTLFICAVVLTFGASYFYLRAISAPRKESEVARPGGILVLAITLLAALSDLTILGGIAPARVAALTVVIGASYLTGAPGGAAMGVAFGVSMDAAIGGNAFFTCVYGFGALIAGVFHNMGKRSFAVIYLCASAAAGLLGADQLVFPVSLAETAMAALLFTLVPQELWQALRDMLLPSAPSAQETVHRMQQSMKQHTADIAQALYEMYLGMIGGMQYGSANEETQAQAVFARAADKVCRHCVLCAGCWEKNYVSTMDSFNQATIVIAKRGRAAAEDFPKHFTTRCIKLPEFLRATNEALFTVQQRREYREKCEENRSLIAQQYAGLTGILQQMGVMGAREMVSLPAREKQVRRYVAAFGQVAQVAVYRDGNRRLRIEIAGEATAQVMQQKQGFTAGLAALLSIGLSEPEILCDELGERLLLREQAPFRAVIGVGQKKKMGESVSGDTGSHFVTEAGQACLLLSDGMGTGEGAARDSRSVIHQMERFLKAGVSIGEAMAAISPAFRLRCQGDRFVTMDALIVDLFTGRAESMKCGAAPSYLQTGGSVTRLSCNTLPVGLSEQDGQAVPLRMAHGDVFVMLTDGVCDGIDDAWVSTLLKARVGDTPKELAAHLLAAAEEQGAADDMSVFVMRIERICALDG